MKSRKIAQGGAGSHQDAARMMRAAHEVPGCYRANCSFRVTNLFQGRVGIRLRRRVGYHLLNNDASGRATMRVVATCR